MIAAAIVEGKANKHGSVRVLRMLCNEETALAELARMRALEAAQAIERSGSIITAASCTVYRANLPSGHKVWQHLPHCGLRIILIPAWLRGRARIVDPIFGCFSDIGQLAA